MLALRNYNRRDGTYHKVDIHAFFDPPRTVETDSYSFAPPPVVDHRQNGTVTPLCLCYFHTVGKVEYLRMIPVLKGQCEWG